MLIADRNEDLQRMYRLVKRIPEGLKEMKKQLELHIAHQGAAAIESCGENVVNNPKSYVQSILEVHGKYSTLLKTAFDSDSGFLGSLDKASEKFINQNSATKAPNSSRKSPELLAMYCDALLKKSPHNPEDAELEECLNRLMIVFKYIQDKDVFESSYEKFLCRRLICQTTASDDAEAYMITALKNDCGLHYTSKLEKMFKDIRLSKDVNDRFIGSLGMGDLDINFSVKVLTSGIWKLKNCVPFSLPSVLESSMLLFTIFYDSQHNGRKLKWLHNMSKGELVTHCFKKKYILTASTYQITVLMQFNMNLVYTVGELQTITMIPLDILIQVVKQLLVLQLLRSEDKADQVTVDTTLNLHLDYKNKKQRIKIDGPLISEAKKEQEQTNGNVISDRKQFLEAATVRIMKARQTSKHSLLVAEICKQTHHRFKADPRMVRKAIEALIQKEYMARMEDEMNTYVYIA